MMTFTHEVSPASNEVFQRVNEVLLTSNEVFQVSPEVSLISNEVFLTAALFNFNYNKLQS